MKPTVAEVLDELRVYDYGFGPADDGTVGWEADCPVCFEETAGYRPLRITERESGGEAWLSCLSRCRWWEILDLLGWDYESRHDDSQPEAVERPRLRFLDVDRLLASEPPPVPWIAEPLLARGAVTMLVGREGHGKSLLALALAAAIGRGDSVAGIGCRPGRAMVLDAENGEAETARRLSGLDVVTGRLAYAEVGDFDLRKHFEEVTRSVAQFIPDVLVLDSLRSLAPGLEENDSGPVEAALAPLRRLARAHDCAVLVLHHAGKIGGGYRGSTAIGAAVELGFTLAPDRPDASDDGHRTLTCWKARIAPRPGPLAFRIETRSGRAHIASAQPRPTAEPVGSRTDELADRLAAIVAEHGALAWSELAALAEVEPESGTAKRARRRAIEDGKLAAHGRGLYGPPPRSTVQANPIGDVDGRTVAEDEERGA